MWRAVEQWGGCRFPRMTWQPMEFPATLPTPRLALASSAATRLRPPDHPAPVSRPFAQGADPIHTRPIAVRRMETWWSPNDVLMGDLPYVTWACRPISRGRTTARPTDPASATPRQSRRSDKRVHITDKCSLFRSSGNLPFRVALDFLHPLPTPFLTPTRSHGGAGRGYRSGNQ